MLDVVVRRRPRGRRRGARPAERRGALGVRARGRARHRRLLERLLPLDEREGVQRDRDLARAQARRGAREPVLHADPPDLHPAVRRHAVQAHADERVAAQRRAHLGAGEGRRRPPARPDPRGRARLLPRAPLPGVRQPRPARRGLARREGDDRRGPRRRAAPQRRLPRLRGRDRAARRRRHPRPLREPLPDVRADHGRGPVPRADAHLPRAALHDGRPVGRLRPDDDDPRAVRDRRGELLRPRREPARRLAR